MHTHTIELSVPAHDAHCKAAVAGWVRGLLNIRSGVFPGHPVTVHAMEPIDQPKLDAEGLPRKRKRTKDNGEVWLKVSYVLDTWAR